MSEVIDLQLLIGFYKSDELRCSECARNIDLCDASMYQNWAEFEVVEAKNFKTGASFRCVGFFSSGS